METITIEAHDLEPDSSDPLRRIAELAAGIEAQPEYWCSQFEQLQRHAIRWPTCAAPPEDKLAGDFALAPMSEPRDGVAPLELRVARLLLGGYRVCVDLDTAAAGEGGTADFDGWYAQLEGRLIELGLAERVAAWSLGAAHPDLEGFLTFAAQAGGEPLVRLPESYMLALRDGTPLEHDPRSANELKRQWASLLERSAAGELVLVLEHYLGGASPLAPQEPAGAVVPGICQASRADAALLWFDFDLSAFVAAARLDERALHSALAQAVRLGDDLLDCVRWPLPEIRADARAHRRLAINLVGIGEMVEALELDPRRFETLQTLVGVAHEARRAACRASRTLALERAPFPGLGAEQLLSLVPAPELAGEVRARLDGQATRNRHLLSISPWAVLPRRPGAVPRHWANLLPVLRYADGLSFRRPPGTPRLAAPELDFFLRLAWAYTRRRAPEPHAPSLTGAYALGDG